MTAKANGASMPAQVLVGGIPYSIEKQDRITVDEQNADGCITYNVCRIQIVDGMPVEVERTVVLHEAMHAIFKGQGQHDYQHDEALLEAIAHGMVQLLRDNPLLVKYLTADQQPPVAAG